VFPDILLGNRECSRNNANAFNTFLFPTPFKPSGLEGRVFSVCKLTSLRLGASESFRYTARMQSSAPTVAAYLASLPADRRAEVETVRKVILKNLDSELVETMQYGMIGYNVPHTRYPAGYHCDPKQPLPYAALASQKNALSLYMMGLYIDSTESKPSALLKWFLDAWKKTGKKLDMGKSCIRFQKADDLALDVIGEAFRRFPAKDFIRAYEANLPEKVKLKMAKIAASRTAGEATGTSKAPAKKPAAKPTAKPASKAKATSKKAAKKTTSKLAAK
jgi:hypothetical protein